MPVTITHPSAHVSFEITLAMYIRYTSKDLETSWEVLRNYLYINNEPSSAREHPSLRSQMSTHWTLNIVFTIALQVFEYFDIVSVA